MSNSRRPWSPSDIDLEVLSAALKRSEEEIALFPESEFPEEHKMARALIAAGRAYIRNAATEGGSDIHDTASYC